jgi:nucleoside-diphosphate-sugar epimerase
MKEKILVTGANGQIGKVLTKKLRDIYGQDQVLASDIVLNNHKNEPYVFLDILNQTRLHEIVEDHQITQIYHLAAILSASGEWNPLKTWNINLNGLLSILNLAKEKKLNKVFFPSTIAVFGNTTPKKATAQNVPMVPETVYGISKVAGELWCQYFNKKYAVDVRSLRYPGIIGYQSIPHGGTTDYAVEIFHSAIKNEPYECFLSKDRRLPMMYIHDAIKATIDLMTASENEINVRTSYNLSSMSFTPEELYLEILKFQPEFKIEYVPDFRDEIAAGWSESIDDTHAREDWNWKPEYNIQSMTQEMLKMVKETYK